MDNIELLVYLNLITAAGYNIYAGIICFKK